MDAAGGGTGTNRTVTRTQLLEATKQALCKHGFVDLTMQSIADESEKSKAALHYHFDTKEDLLAETLAYLLEEFLEEVDTGAEGDPETRLRALVEAMLFGPNGRDGDSSGHWTFHTALLEVQAHAPHDETFRAQFSDNNDHLLSLYTDIIEEGIDSGVFEPVDPEATATHLVAAIEGARVTQVSTECDTVAETVHDSLTEHVIDPMVREG
ncbi:TetR family transcriptional regulator [Halapricum sp. CBA1109]|uniref:TetR/AcrR family transcriptional regulator n=1 Tax=Halapricum sp. CBA1109 TaxID=2668068 RepID=UPI0012FB1E9A|nr:TetR/AcrR family transcriptional regulator [Halapricum sp. CBA1109]MUV90214.1 TetR family transcriptional regulator [Halapricum sp. CBA1109]